MFIGHLPGGYLATAGILSLRRDSPKMRRALLVAGLVASVLPDLDLIYFYIFDARHHLHHTYWPHRPAFWLVFFVLAAPAAACFPRFRGFYLVASANIFVHLGLDSIAAEVFWLYPFSPDAFGLVTVPSVYGWWVLNFLFHWSFTLELVLVATAITLTARAWRSVGWGRPTGNHTSDSGRDRHDAQKGGDQRSANAIASMWR